MGHLTVREASLADASRILEIYAPYIRETTYTFEYEVPSLTEFEQRMKGIMKRYPYLVCEEQGRVIAYAYAGTYMSRAAYDWCADLSVYVAQEKRGGGAGTLLYRVLFAILKEMQIQNLYAVITGENQRSVQFHKGLGFETFAVYQNVGYKHGKWLNVCWMQKFLGEHEKSPERVVWAPELGRTRIQEIICSCIEECS